MLFAIGRAAEIYEMSEYLMIVVPVFLVAWSVFMVLLDDMDRDSEFEGFIKAILMAVIFSNAFAWIKLTW